MHRISSKKAICYRQLLTLLLCAGLVLFIVGCSDNSGSIGGNVEDGGETWSDGTRAEVPDSTITGIVSGAVILAANDRGEIIDSYDTTGTTPDVDSDSDGENDAYSFELTGIPADTAIRIYLISEGQIFPMYFASTVTGTTPDTNVFFISAGITIDLGWVDISGHDYTGKAIPRNNPIAVAGVTAGPENPDIPDEIIIPETTGLSIETLINDGFGYLINGGFHMAATYLKQAIEETTAGTEQGDRARFFYALARVASAATMTFSDADAADMSRVGDFIDGIGVGKSDTIRSNLEAIYEAINALAALAETSPNGSDLQALLNNTLIPEVKNAIDDLGLVSENFAYATILPHGNDEVEFDYADVLAVKAGMHALLAVLQIQDSYDVDMDIDEAANNENTTIESILAGNADLLTLKTGHQLAAARTNLSNAIDSISAAVSAIVSETDPQGNDFINLADVSAEEIADFRETLAIARDAVDSPPTTVDDKQTADTGDDVILNSVYFFDGLNLRAMLPPFSGDEVSGLFPNSTIGGVIVQGLDINADNYNEYGDPSPDGVPDILQDI